MVAIRYTAVDNYQRTFIYAFPADLKVKQLSSESNCYVGSIINPNNGVSAIFILESEKLPSTETYFVTNHRVNNSTAPTGNNYSNKLIHNCTINY